MDEGIDLHTIGGRLLFLIDKLRSMNVLTKENKMDSGSFARSIPINESQFSRITQNKLNITLTQVMEISSIYMVRSGWILEGELPIFQNEKSGAQVAPDDVNALIKNEAEKIQISLDRIKKAVQETAYLDKLTGQRRMGHLSLGKKDRSVGQKNNEKRNHPEKGT